MIILARHGQTEWNKAKRVQGWANSPLTELGIQQAHKVAAALSNVLNGKPYTLTCSPLGRAMQTADIIATELKYPEAFTPDSLLKEYSFGEWKGMTIEEVKAQRFEEWNARKADKWNYLMPGGESYAILSGRAKQWLSNLPAEQTTVAVTHEMIGKTIRGAYLGLEPAETLTLRQANNEIIVLENGGKTKISV